MATVDVVIPELKKATAYIQLIGVTPLIMHRFGELAVADLERTQVGDEEPKVRRRKKARNPDAEFRDALWLLAGDRQGDLSTCIFGWPTRAIKRCIVIAGQRFGSEHGTILNGAISMPTTMVRLDGPPPVMGTDMVRLSGINRPTSVAYRPYFEPWSMVVPVQFNPDWVAKEQLINLFRIGGFSIGLGDWRVEKKGTFGQFAIGEVEMAGI